MQVFIDTSYLIAILEPNDDRHEKAKTVSQSLGSIQQITSEMVLTELLNAFCTRGKFFRQMVLNVVDVLRSAPNVEIIPQSPELFEQAYQYYRQRPDKQYSLTDCASMVIMRERGIDKVLTHDRHFQQEGFIALLRDK
jgi:predicted nucleic acid-binding protein